MNLELKTTPRKIKSPGWRIEPKEKLPARMVVALDGWTHSGKNTVGELVAAAIGGVLVDSGRFYRALTKSCLLAGVNLDDPRAVAYFCRTTTLSVHLTRDGRMDEAQVVVNGQCFTEAELRLISEPTSKVARVIEVRHFVNMALYQCLCSFKRVVMLGRDIGGVVVPQTPYKFVLDAPKHIREQRHFQSMGVNGAVERDQRDEKQVVFASSAVKIDTSSPNPHEACKTILIHIWRRLDAPVRSNLVIVG